MAVAYALLAVFAFIDFVTGYELSSSILYLVPIYLVSEHRTSTKTDSILVAGISSLCWLLVDHFSGHLYSQFLIFFWNGAVRVIIFFTMALAIQHIKSKRIELEEANRRLQQLSLEKNKYIGIAAHDIRNPLGNIYLISRLLLDTKNREGLSKQQLEFIELIGKISTGALNLLGNILDISQIEAGTLRIEKQEQDWVSFLQETIRMNSSLAHEKQQRIELHAASGQLPLPFDQNYMGQVMMNLLANAIKFSFKDTVIKVVVQEEEQWVRTRVIDQGVGIRKEDKDKIFKPFVKAANSSPTAGERSSGLGLAIVKKVVEAHGGTISVESTYGRGAAFSFTIPKVSQPVTTV